MSSEKKRKRLPLYSGYVFRQDQKDPVIDTIHTWFDDAGTNYNKASEASGVSASTLYNWIEGKTKRPQFCTIMAVAHAFGKEIRWVNKRATSNIISMGSRQHSAV